MSENRDNRLPISPTPPLPSAGEPASKCPPGLSCERPGRNRSLCVGADLTPPFAAASRGTTGFEPECCGEEWIWVVKGRGSSSSWVAPPARGVHGGAKEGTGQVPG